MEREHQLVGQVYAAKQNMRKADKLIRDYIPFIRSETSKFLKRICSEQDDEFSVAMIAFHEAIRGYEKSRGAFLSYAKLIIRSRLIDHARREERHRGQASLDYVDDDSEETLADKLSDGKDEYTDSVNLQATKQEILELNQVMQEFGLSLTDVSQNSPKQERTLESCLAVIAYAKSQPFLLDEMLRTKKLPMKQLVEGTRVERKTIERHRKYLMAMLLIQTNGYEMIRGHLRHVFEKKGGATQ